MVEWLFLAVPWDCLRFVIVVFPDHTDLLFLVCHFRGILDANLKRGHNDKSSTGKNKLMKAQLLSLIIFKT